MHQFHPAIAASLAAFALFACNAPAPCPPVEERFTHPVLSISPDNDANVAAVEAYLNALVKTDTAAIRAALAPGFFANNTFTPADSSDVAAVTANWVKNGAERSDQKVHKYFAQCVRIAEGNEYAGDWVQYWGKYSATDKATGKPYVVPFFMDSRLKDGKLVKSYTYFDRLSVSHQLGTKPPAAPEKAKEAKKK